MLVIVSFDNVGLCVKFLSWVHGSQIFPVLSTEVFDNHGQVGSLKLTSLVYCLLREDSTRHMVLLNVADKFASWVQSATIVKQMVLGQMICG